MRILDLSESHKNEQRKAGLRCTPSPEADTSNLPIPEFQAAIHGLCSSGSFTTRVAALLSMFANGGPAECRI